MVCSKCGAEIPEEEETCPACGASVENGENEEIESGPPEDVEAKAEEILAALEEHQILYFSKKPQNQRSNKIARHQWVVRLKALLRDLQPLEEIIYCFVGLHRYQKATKNMGFYVYAMTNQRFVMVGFGAGGSLKSFKKDPKCTIEAIAVKDLEPFTYDIMEGEKYLLYVHTEEETLCVQSYSGEKLERLADCLNKVLRQLQNGNPYRRKK